MIKKVIYTLVIMVFILSGCSSGVSQEEYDKVVKERDAALSDYQKEAEKYQDLTQQRKWAQAAYGDTALLSTYEDTFLEIIVPTNEEITEELVSKCYAQYLDSFDTLQSSSIEYPDLFKYKRISITFLDLDNYGIFTSEFINDGSSYDIGTTLITLFDTETVASGFHNALIR